METYIDLLPTDVIRVFIMPHLNYSERFALNSCIPVLDRIPKRMNKASIEKHEQDIIIPIIKRYLERNFDLWDSATKQIENMLKVFKLLQQPRYFVLIQMHTSFRLVMMHKIRVLIQELIDYKKELELGTRLKLASELKKLRNKIDTSGPYTDRITLDNVPRLSFD